MESDMNWAEQFQVKKKHLYKDEGLGQNLDFQSHKLAASAHLKYCRTLVKSA